MKTRINFNADWTFIKGMSAIDEAYETSEVICLPHTWNAVDGQDGGNDYYRGTCCYKKSFSKKDLPDYECLFLEIKGANSSADVVLNGQKLMHHDGGYSTWRVDLTKYVEEENTVMIFVDNAPNETVYPQTADFTFYGGLYRDVNIIATASTHFNLMNYGGSGLVVTPIVKGKDAQVNVELDVVHIQAEDQFYIEIVDQDTTVVHSAYTKDTAYTCRIENVHLWQGVKDPYLYTIVVKLVRNEVVLDTVSTRFGCREFEIHPEKGFILNGIETPLRGVSRHQDRWQIGNALLKEHHDEDMNLICELGANTIRLAHYQHDDYFYDLCDEKGMIVWAEIPYISRHMSDANENTIEQMKELITQCRNHPSIVVWGLSNEITMDGAKNPDLIQNHKVLNDVVHRMDPTRPTTIACISMCGIDEEVVHIADVVAYNHYFGWYGGSIEDYGPWFDNFHKKYPNLPIGVSEYGCEALNWHNSKPEQGDYSEEYQAIYHESLIRQLFTRPYLWATHVWNMFDFGADARAEGGENGQNHKGLITFDRTYKKDAFYAYKAWLSEDPFVHLCGKRYVDRVEDVTKITVYSNQPQVSLYVNGELFETKEVSDHFFYFEVPNVGETHLKAVAKEWQDESVIRKVDTMNQDYILKEQGAVLNWFDITEIEGRFSLNDKISEIIKTLRGKIWLFGLFIILAKKQSGPKDKTKKKKNKTKTQVDSGVINMIGGFSVLRFTGMLGMRNVYFTKEELLKLNRQLNKIKKP